jgi:hypothetical protein
MSLGWCWRIRARCPEALVVIADDELDALQAPGLERAQELKPGRLGLDLAEVQADDLAAAALVHRVGDHRRLGSHVPVVADLQLLGAQPQIGVGPVERSLPEQLDLLV